MSENQFIVLNCLASLDVFPPLANCNHCILITKTQVMLEVQVIEKFTARQDWKKLNINLACIDPTEKNKLEKFVYQL